MMRERMQKSETNSDGDSDRHSDRDKERECVCVCVFVDVEWRRVSYSYAPRDSLMCVGWCVWCVWGDVCGLTCVIWHVWHDWFICSLSVNMFIHIFNMIRSCEWLDICETSNSYIVFQSTCVFVYVSWFGHASDLICVIWYAWHDSFIYRPSINMWIHIRKVIWSCKWLDVCETTHSYTVFQSTCVFVYVSSFGHASDWIFVKQLIHI